MTTKPNWALLAGVRWIAAFAVLLMHLPHYLIDGTAEYYNQFEAINPVPLFLIVSGYSIHASYQKQADGFFWRRFWRIAPVYVVALLLAQVPFLIWGTTLTYDWEQTKAFQGIGATVRQFLFLQPILAPAPAMADPLWTLGVEVAFYILAPLLFKFPRWAIAGLVLASAIYYVSTPLSAYENVNPSPYLRLFWAFGLGWLLFGFGREPWRFAVPAAYTVVVAASGMGLGATVIALVFSSLVAFNSLIQLRPGMSRVLEYLGDLSYETYALHAPITWILNFSGATTIALAAIPPILVVSSLVLHLIDRPLRKIGRRSIRRPITSPRELVPQSPGAM